MKIRVEGDYAKERARAYPPLTELADAIYHESTGNPGPMREYQAKVAAVKRAYPKPEGKP